MLASVHSELENDEIRAFIKIDAWIGFEISKTKVILSGWMDQQPTTINGPLSMNNRPMKKAMKTV